MPRLSLAQTNFVAGELSPRLHGRTDIDRYANGAKVLFNTHPVIHGGAVRRAGTRFAKAAKFAATRCRLVEFVVSRDIAYMLEFGDFYVRIFRPGGAYLLEIASPYSEQQAQEIDFTQGADTMFLWHGAVYPQRLRRFSDTSWDLSATPFTTEPFEEQGHTLPALLVLTATSGSITIAAGNGVFLPSDVGRLLISGAGVGTVNGYTSATSIDVDVTVPFASTTLLPGQWRLDASPRGFAIPSAKEPTGASIKVVGAMSRAANLTLTAKTGSITIDASSAVFVIGDTGVLLYADSGVAALTYVSPTRCTAVTSADFASLSYPSGGWGIAGGVFRAEDAGKFVRVNGGLARVTLFGSAAFVNATIVTPATSIVASPAGAWSLEGSVWSSAAGYPRTGTLHEQRLWAAGSTKFPQTIWASKTGLYLDFTKGTVDSDACIFTIASDEVNPITFLASGRTLLAHTYGGEFSVQGGSDKPITPSNVKIKPESRYGSKTVRPLTIGKESVFVQRAGRKVRTMAFQFAADGYVSPDITVMAEHITLPGIVSIAYQQEPDFLLWLVLADGSMATCTFEREQSVSGWARHYTDGIFESVAVVPTATGEQVWVVVRRIVGGAVVRYLEWFDADFSPMLPATANPNALPPLAAAVVYGTTVDAAVQVDSTAGQSTFTGLAHLEGKAVDVVADGSAMPRLTVTGGSITLPRASKRTLIGLPFSSRVQLLTPEAGTGTGTAQGNSMRVGEITLRFLNTLGATIKDGQDRPQDVPFRHFGPAVLDQAVAPFTGLVRIEMLGWERGRADLIVEQTQPLPMHLLGVIRKTTIND